MAVSLQRLAIFSPLPPARTGIADYSAALLPHLARLLDLTVFVDRPDAVVSDLRRAFDVQPLDAYPPQRWEFDLALYQLGNSSQHDALYQTFLAYPGVAVLHDYGLHHFVEHRTAGQGDPAAYARQLGYALGPAGLDLAADIRYGRVSPPWYTVPLNEQVIDRALGLIVHSQYVRNRLQERRRDRPTAVVPALIESHPSDPRRARPDWPFPPDALVFAAAGQITRSKQLDLALRAFAQLRREQPEARFLLIGQPLPAEVDLPALLTDLELETAVHCTGFVPDLADFAGWIAAADAIVNLRHPTVGETSATALRAMAAGRPLIVFDQGWYAELPDDVALKLPPMDEDALLAGMRRLAAAPDLRRRMGRRAAEQAVAHHSPAHIAERYVAALEGILAALMEPLHA